MKLEDMKLTQEEKDDLAFAEAVATVDGSKPSEFAKILFIRYKRGEMDLETCKREIRRAHTNNRQNEN